MASRGGARGKKNHNKSINCRRFSDVSPFPKPILEGLISDNQQWIYSKTGILKVIEVLQDNLHFSSANPGYSWCFFSATVYEQSHSGLGLRKIQCIEDPIAMTTRGEFGIEGQLKDTRIWMAKTEAKLPALNQPTEKS